MGHPATSPSLSIVKVVTTGTDLMEVPVESFGTRHRSAFRFCSSLEDSIAFVLSQDGGVKAVKRHGKDVLMWPDINTGAMGI
jgi:DNA integrity scanning protein DisA with diadenylate cyclase activity